jgi:hypothetical protein
MNYRGQGENFWLNTRASTALSTCACNCFECHALVFSSMIQTQWQL